MTDDRYIVLRVVYERQFTYGRSLLWVAPELSDVGLTMTADEIRTPVPSRTWAGIVDCTTYKRLADAWRLGPEIDARARGVGPAQADPQAGSYVLDGMNWELDGQSPIVYVMLLVSATAGRGCVWTCRSRPEFRRSERSLQANCQLHAGARR
jgi:hypothetical protein